MTINLIIIVITGSVIILGFGIWLFLDNHTWNGWNEIGFYMGIVGFASLIVGVPVLMGYREPEKNDKNKKNSDDGGWVWDGLI